MKKAELILILIAILAVTLHLLNIGGGSFLTTIFSLILSLLYFPLGIFLFNDVKLSRIGKKESYNGLNVFKQVSFVLIGMALQVLVLAILFKVMFWPGANIMSVMGLVTIVPVFIISVIAFINGPRKFFSKIVKRVIVYSGLAMLLAFMPKYYFLDIKYREYPELAAVLKAYYEDPGNAELHKKMDEEMAKMYGIDKK